MTWSRTAGRRPKVRPIGAAPDACGHFPQPDRSVLSFGAARIEFLSVFNFFACFYIYNVVILLSSCFGGFYLKTKMRRINMSKAKEVKKELKKKAAKTLKEKREAKKAKKAAKLV